MLAALTPCLLHSCRTPPQQGWWRWQRRGWRALGWQKCLPRARCRSGGWLGARTAALVAASAQGWLQAWGASKTDGEWEVLGVLVGGKPELPPIPVPSAPFNAQLALGAQHDPHFPHAAGTLQLLKAASCLSSSQGLRQVRERHRWARPRGWLRRGLAVRGGVAWRPQQQRHRQHSRQQQQ